MRRALSLILCCALACSLLAGCSNTTAGNGTAKETALTGIAENEIFTYDKIDPEKTVITVARAGNIYVRYLCNAFMELNPDIQVVYLDITAGNGVVMPYLDWLQKGYCPDVMFLAGPYVEDITLEDYFEDLTTNSLLDRYEVEQLNHMAVDGRVYALPGPAALRGIYYNKTLFDQYGWQPPTTMDEFITLCQQIEADTDGAVQAWNPNAKYDGELASAMEAFTYAELFGGVENRSWYNELLAGDANFTSHMQPYYDLYQRFLDAGIFKEDYFTYSSSTRMEEFKTGKIAMINSTIGKATDSPDYEVGFVPFPSTVEGEGYLVQNSDYAVTVPIKERTQEQKDATQKFLDYISTAEAQKLFIDKALMISSLKDSGDINSRLPDSIKNAQQSGHIFSQLTFKNSSYPQSYAPQKLLRDNFMSIYKGEMTAAECMASMDAAQAAALNGEKDADEEPIATAAEDFTILETSNYFADMFRETADADIGLVLNNTINRGNVMLIFEGDLTPSHVVTLKPRSFASKSTLVKVSMTGRQLLDALDHPYGSDTEDANCVYAVSGLKCTVAPWNELGSKVLSVTMADGTAIDEAKLYTVAIWQGTVHEEYITEELKSYEGTFEELLTAKLETEQTIAPASDGRMTLQWD